MVEISNNKTELDKLQSKITDLENRLIDVQVKSMEKQMKSERGTRFVFGVMVVVVIVNTLAVLYYAHVDKNNEFLLTSHEKRIERLEGEVKP